MNPTLRYRPVSNTVVWVTPNIGKASTPGKAGASYQQHNRFVLKTHSDEGKSLIRVITVQGWLNCSKSLEDIWDCHVV